MQNIQTDMFLEGARPGTVRKANIRATLEVLRTEGALSRAELTKRTGVSAPTMLKLITDLLAADLIEELERPPEGKGRPSKVYQLNRKTVHVAGLVIGIQQCRVFTAGLDGCFDESRVTEFITPKTYKTLIRTCRKQLDKMLSNSPRRCLGLAVTVPGLFNHNESRVMLSPNLRYLDNQTPGLDISEGYDMETITLHEEHALCLAAHGSNSRHADENVAVIDISQGLGMGIISGGTYVHGHAGYAGEIGHITVEPHGKLCGCGNHGCLETVATDGTLIHTLSKQLGQTLTIDDIVTFFEQGKPEAVEAIDVMIGYLAIGVATVINLFNPATAFIHSRLFQSSEVLFEQLKNAVSKRALAPSLAACSLQIGEGTREQGTAAAINNHLFEKIGPSIG
jgi:predicted NBD/HSP70 family sugar kinase